MARVLLTNGQQRKTLAAARSLGAKGVQVLAAEETRFNPTFFSKHCTQKSICPNPGQNPEEFYSWLKKILKQCPCDVLFPMDDDSLEVIMENRVEIEKLCNLPLPPYESYLLASDKGRSTMLAIESGVDCPMTVIPESVEQLYDISNNLTYPVVIKPRKSSGSRGIRIIKCREELFTQYTKINEIYPNPIIQEYIGLGDRFDVCMLFDSKHELKAYFVQKEIRHFPVDIGPSTVQESIVLPELVEKSLAIMNRLEWYGVVELEFMMDKKDGKYKFMEINPRFWNSLQMAIFAGVDFPWMLYNLAMGNDVENVYEYKQGVKCQGLLPGDLLHFIVNKDRLKMDPPILPCRKHNMKDDILSSNDPLPAIGFMLACLRYLFDIKMWSFMFRR